MKSAFFGGIVLSLCFTLGMGTPAMASELPRLMLAGEDSEKGSVPRDSKVFKRMTHELLSMLQLEGFQVYDERILFSQTPNLRRRRHLKHLLDVGRDAGVDVIVIFSLFWNIENLGYAKKVFGRIEGQLLGVLDGRRLGAFERSVKRGKIVASDCSQACFMEAVGHMAKALAGSLSEMLHQKLVDYGGSDGGRASGAPMKTMAARASRGAALRSAPSRGEATVQRYAPLSRRVKSEPEVTEKYDHIDSSRFLKVLDNPRSTFSVDVDTASYSHVRRYLLKGQMPPKDSVRIEELLNYFSYDYPEPKDAHPFSVTLETSVTPWQPEHRLVHIGLRGKSYSVDERPPFNLVFLMDVSGSMRDDLPMVKSAMKMLVKQMRAVDSIAIVVYAGAAGVVLSPTTGAKKETILNALDALRAGGSTAGGQGIRLAYQLAQEHRRKGANNRVILVTDGDFNVGITSRSDLISLVAQKRKTDIFLTVLGFGRGNINNATMELLADKGNGHYLFIDSLLEARKALVDGLGGLLTIAKDVKVQVEFNPAKVASYRLIGYENRRLQNEDFMDDSKDAGEVGAGHTVTALYEIMPATLQSSGDSGHTYVQTTVRPEAQDSSELMTVHFRYKLPTGSKSIQIKQSVVDHKVDLNRTSDNFRFSAAVAEFGLLLRDSPFKGKGTLSQALALAKGAKGVDEQGYRSAFIRLVQLTENILP